MSVETRAAQPHNLHVTPAAQPYALHFDIVADASPGLLPRLLQPLAKRDLMPERLNLCHAAGRMLVEIQLAEIPADVLRLVEGNLRQVVGVHSVMTNRPAAQIAA